MAVDIPSSKYSIGAYVSERKNPGTRNAASENRTAFAQVRNSGSESSVAMELAMRRSCHTETSSSPTQRKHPIKPSSTAHSRNELWAVELESSVNPLKPTPQIGELLNIPSPSDQTSSRS